MIKSRELMALLVEEKALAPSLIKGTHKPMYKSPYGVARVKSAMFLEH